MRISDWSSDVCSSDLGEVLVDEGAIANVELRYSMTDELTGFVFYDAARGDFNHDPGPFDVVNKRSLRGPGIGFNYTKHGNFSINMSVASRTTDPALNDGGERKTRRAEERRVGKECGSTWTTEWWR